MSFAVKESGLVEGKGLRSRACARHPLGYGTSVGLVRGASGTGAAVGGVSRYLRGELQRGCRNGSRITVNNNRKAKGQQFSKCRCKVDHDVRPERWGNNSLTRTAFAAFN